MTYWDFLRYCASIGEGATRLYKEDAWKEYSEEELIAIARFFAKRSGHRLSNKDKLRDVTSAINYLAMLGTSVQESMESKRD